MSKAYDRVEWGFLEKMMYKLRFEERWIKVVMLCISTVSYRFKVNGECTDVVVPQRGIRQDDSLVLMKASRECAIHLQYMLNLYEVCSGQVVNFDKSSVMFSKNTSAVQKQHVLAELRIGNVTRSERYLGLPVHVGMNKTKMFEYLKERMWNRIQGWLERLMSKAAKDVLIKACAQAIPTFAMSCFDLTKTLCEQMGEMICHFLWAKQEKTRTMHWLSWELKKRSKEEGGLGFRDLHGFNLAMLVKQAWRILTEPESLCARVLKAKYFPNTSVLEAQANPGISYTWRSILKGVELLKEGLICRIGDGTSVKIWSDPWLNREGSRLPKTMRGRCLLTRVCELIDLDTGSWDEQLVRNIFIGEDIKVILSTPIRDDFDDFYTWFPDSKGTFRVKSAYRLYTRIRDAGLASTSHPVEGIFDWRDIWKITCQPKIQQFIWRFAHNSLPLLRGLKRRGIECDTLCVCCRRLDEDGAHLFLRCKEVKQVWRALQLKEVRLRMCACPDARDVIKLLLELDEEKKTLVVCMLWFWWLRQNKINAKEKGEPIDGLIAKIYACSSDQKNLCVPKGNWGNASMEQVWRRPAGDKLKINIDGSFHAESGTGGWGFWGFVVRDSQGDVRGSGAGCLLHVASAIQAEATACLEAFQAVADWGMMDIIVETDCQSLVRAVQGNEFDLAPEGVFFKDLRLLAQLQFNSVSFSFTPRGCNILAHAIAALGACGHSPKQLWSEVLPDDVNVRMASVSAEPVG